MHVSSITLHYAAGSSRAVLINARPSASIKKSLIGPADDTFRSGQVQGAQ
jgi:hypothetical protein